MRWYLGLGPRLILALALPIGVVGIAYGRVASGIHERELVDKVVDGASQLSRGITSATWHSMLADRRRDAYEVIETIGRRNGIERIRLFDNQGRTAFSTDPGTAPRVGKDSEPCAVCHNGGTPHARIEEPRRSRIFTGPDGTRRLGIVTAIYNEPSCSQAACHAHPGGQSVLGVLDVTVGLAQVDAEIGAMQERVLLLGLVHLGIVVAVILVSVHFLVAKPIRGLIGSTRAISEMDLDRPVGATQGSELGELAEAVDRMRLRLREAVGDLAEAKRLLEVKVEERGRQLRDAERRLIQSDRMASLGQLAGVVAHEINNPISAVHNFSMVMGRILTEKGVPAGREQEFSRHLVQVQEQTARVGRIVSDLLSFARRSTPRLAKADFNAVVGRTLSLVRHKLDLGRVEVRLGLAEGLPAVHCDASQMEQVVLNLLMNAAESMPEGGRVAIRTALHPSGDSVALEVEDAGVGIPPENLRHIFDPFFSTKEPGKGVGLGLAVVYGIVEAHGGGIDVESTVGKGTTFRVRIPVARKAQGDRPGGDARDGPAGRGGEGGTP
jgi:two-component system NtrC family sensor kinase